MYIENLRNLMLEAGKQGIPFSGLFEITSRCNLHCKFCYVCDRVENVEILPEKTTAEWLDMINQAAEAGMLACTFTGGDPFMREDFEEIYCKAYDMGLRISLLTNAILIGKKQIEYLSKRKPDSISISLYGASESSYETICGNGYNFNRVLKSLDRLQEAGLPFEIKALALRPLIKDYESMGQIASAYNCKGRFELYICPGRDDANRLVSEWRIPTVEAYLAQDSFLKWFRDQSGQPTQKVKMTSLENRDNTAISCSAGKSAFMITYDGRMLGCPSLTCFKTFPFSYGFNSAWNSLKDMVENAKPCDECLECSEYDVCSKCPANRLSETGSITHCSEYLHELAHGLSLHNVENVV